MNFHFYTKDFGDKHFFICLQTFSTIYRHAKEPPKATKMSSRADETGEHLERFLQDLKIHVPLLEAETRHIKELKQKTDDKVRYKYIYEACSETIETHAF